MNPLYRKLMELTILVAWAGFFVFILLTHRLPLYINPKFTMLPILAVGLLVGMVIAGIPGAIAAARGKDEDSCGHSHGQAVGWASGSWNMLPILLGLVIAPASLGSFVANDRGVSTSGAGNSGIMLNLASESEYKDVTVCQLADAGQISKGKVTVEGQIPDDAGSVGPTACPLVHYRMVCCVEDLQPVAVMLKYPAGHKPTAGQWVRVQGLAERTSAGVEVDADAINPINEPDPPYLY